MMESNRRGDLSSDSPTTATTAGSKKTTPPTSHLVLEDFIRDCRLTTQAQRPGAREATIVTATLPPGSLQRLVRPRHHVHLPSLVLCGCSSINWCCKSRSDT